MIRAPKSDFWQVGLLRQSLGGLLTNRPDQAALDRIAWLPDPGPWRYLADPFGLRRNGRVHVFVEAYDYRSRHGVIEHHELDADLNWQGKSTVLSRPFHLSYPFVFEHLGEVFMIPEAHRAGEITLYRATEFPSRWARETTLLPATLGAEASVVRLAGRWWMFYTVVGRNRRDQRELHVASADQLTGPWRAHPLNPVLNDPRGARPGGTPFVTPAGHVILPVQDCSESYGGAARFLSFTTLSPDRVACEHVGPRITGSWFSSTHVDGCHTLSQCGDLTLFDVKRVVRSWGRHAINLQRRLLRLV